jgi:hypothetical protein
MLVYLDSAHFALLERASVAERADFFSMWTDMKYELALSLHHLQEIGQLRDATSIRRRLAVVEQFPIIRGKPAGSATVLDLELQIQMIALLGVTADPRRSSDETLFPIADRRSLFQDALSTELVFKYMQGAHKLGAQAENASKAARRESGPSIPPESMWKDMEQAMGRFANLIPNLKPVVQTFVSEMTGRLSGAIQSEGSTRLALIALYGLRDVASVDGVLDADLPSVAVYFQTAREQVVAVAARLGVDEATASAVIPQLNPYDSPGFSLQLAVRRARAAHPKDDVASDQIDADHLAFAPYVNRLFVDKRTLGFVRQESSRDPARLQPATTLNIAKAGTIAELTGVLAA